MTQQQGLAYINRLVDQQAFMLSVSDIFAASAALFLVLIAIVWLARPAKSGGSSADAAGAH
jgi:DHA2 family multidrug resistance protein